MKRYALVFIGLFLVILSGYSQSGMIKTDHLEARLARPGLWVIQGLTGAPSTMYLLEGSEMALLIDTGTGQENLSEFVARLTGKPLLVALTHGHGDHSGGSGYFPEVYLHPKDLSLAGKRGSTTFLPMQEGDQFDLGDLQIEVIETPGHTPGSVVFLDRKNRCLFSGDAFGSGDVWMQLAHSLPLSQYLASVRKAETFLPAFQTLWYGHEEQIKEKADPSRYLTDMRKTAEQILAGEKGEPNPSGGNTRAMVLKTGSARIVFDPEKL